VPVMAAPMTINTNATGATFGTGNNAPFRLWLVAFLSAGALIPALWQSVTGGATPTAIAALNEAAVASTTGISGSATAAGTFYTPNGISLTNCPFRILGYLEWSAGLATAGAYASGPTTIEVFGPGVKRPGEVVQKNYMTTTSSTSVSASTTVTSTNVTKSITPTSAPNLIRAEYSGTLLNGFTAGTNSSNISTSFVYRGTTALASQVSSNAGVNAGSGVGPTTINVPVHDIVWDAPGTTSSTTYTVKIANSTATSSITTLLGDTNDVGRMELAEIMT